MKPLSAYDLSVSEDCAAAEYLPLAVSNVISKSGNPIVKTIKVPYSENRFPGAQLALLADFQTTE